MGQEISGSRFTKRDFTRFSAHLAQETQLLARWFDEQAFGVSPCTGGLELEAWLVGADMQPAPLNAQFLEALQNPLAFPELAAFNIELNSAPSPLTGDALRRMQAELEALWAACRRAAATLGVHMVMIGTLPTVRQEMLTLANMSGMARYRALNEQVLRVRRGRPLQLDIEGHEILRVAHHDVMLEAATTSFQIHLQAAPEQAVRFYNAAIVASAPMVALSANSPYLFGHDLWEETRIPLFEQAVEVGGFEGAAFGPIKRVTFGSGYASESLLECFRENLEHYPVLLPVELDGPAEALNHLRLHNGTIWRWNRPLIGFDVEGRPTLRVEHRVVPAGPTIGDAVANAAFFHGLAHALAHLEAPPELQLPFADARDNFYAAARHGLGATVAWLRGQRLNVRELILGQLIPLARVGLEGLGIDAGDVDHSLRIVAGRVQSGRTGSAWQRAFVAAHGRDWQGLVRAYLVGQESGVPVHEWPV
ncbi:glutamate--cysteine ligase [Ectothiorhodospiraceae bacterium 2226]|nr:glutamate--cysteine ligase [Ectothiorhodospiraceae bacterium 2226]